MNAELKEAFSRIKPVCDVVMVCPTPDSIAAFVKRIRDLKKEIIQELQQYILFPFITHLNSTEIEKKHDIQSRLADAMRIVLERVTVNNFEMCMKIEIGLLCLVFDSSKNGMIADVSEELKHSVIKCLTTLMLNLERKQREKVLKQRVPLLAQAIFVSVHIAKLEKLRALRLAAIECVMAHTVTHPKLTTDLYQIPDPSLEILVVDMLSSILPGLLAALQDVATCSENPGHAVIVASLEAIHRILCLPMNDKYLSKKDDISVEDFAKMIKEKWRPFDNDTKEVSSKAEKDPKDIVKRSPEWYAMAGDKLTLITKSLICLRTHEHYKVRKELAVFCSRLLFECNKTMQPSIPLALDVLMSLSKDDYPEIAQYCTRAVNMYFANATDETRLKTMDTLCDNFFTTLTTLPRILNNIDSARKLSALNLLHGYVQVMCDEARPQRLTTALSLCTNMQCLCDALLHAAAVHSDLTLLTQHAVRDVTSRPPTDSPWCKLRHLDTQACEQRLQETCRLLGNAECAELVLDRLLELFQQRRDGEIAYIINYMGSASDSSPSLVKRILNVYIEEDVWYSPLEVTSSEPAPSEADTLDIRVYNPTAWEKDSVPDLYEGAIETRYTDISYQTPRPQAADPNACATLAQAQRNMLLSCLLTEGVGVMATRLGEHFQPYLLKTLCMVLERVGSKFEMLHLSGLKALNAISTACGHSSVAELINCNADYFTHQVTLKLKKAWNSESALQILSVVMEYSDASILNCLYGIVQDVLVQSCDKYYEKNLYSYLQVFLTFVECIKKWFPRVVIDSSKGIDIVSEVKSYIENTEEVERLLSNEEFEKESGKTVEEMYREDMKRKEEDLLDYDDKVTEEKPPLPQYITVTVTILRRCIKFVACRPRDETLLALQVLSAGLPALEAYEDELLPLVHAAWPPLVASFQAAEPAVLKRALELLVTMATLSKDFIRSRALTDVLPNLYKYLHLSSEESVLKDSGSAYRASAAYHVQAAALGAMAGLVENLALQEETFEENMSCVRVYLSKNQPKPLQMLAIDYFKRMLKYCYGVTWQHLRVLCNNEQVLPPPHKAYAYHPVTGTPYDPIDKDYEYAIKLIFEDEIKK